MGARAEIADLVNWLAATFPILQWSPAYKPQWIGTEIVAAITLTAFAIPESMAYARLAGLAPQFGFYASLLAGLTYAIFGTSRHVAYGPTSALSVVVATSLAAAGFAAKGDAQVYASMAAALAILVALISFAARILHLGVLINFISDSVLVGFSAGAGLYIASTQLGELFGISNTSGEFFERLWEILIRFHEVNVPTLILGSTGIVVLLVAHQKFPRFPSPLVVILASILLVRFSPLSLDGVNTIGTIPPGLPQISWPHFGLVEMRRLLPGAAAVFLLSYIEGMGVMRFLAKKHDYKINANQEFVALGAANLVCGLGSGFPVGGSMSRSAVNDQMGAQTQLTNALSGVLLLIVLLFFTDVFTTLPEAILAAVVCVAAKRLIDVQELRYLYSVSRSEFGIALISLLGVLLFGVVNGVLIGVVLSVALFLGRATYPQVTILGRIPHSGQFVDTQFAPEYEDVAGVLACQIHARLFFANAPIVLERLQELIEASIASHSNLQLLVLDLSTSPTLDLSAAMMLHALFDDCGSKGIALAVANASGQARGMMERVGLQHRLGPLRTNVDVQTVLVEAAIRQVR